MSNSRKKLISNIFSVGVIQFANYAFPIITISIISRIIGPERFGIINFASSFVAYFTLLIGFGFDVTATRKISSDPSNTENRNKVFSEVFTAQLFLLLFSIIVFSIFLVCVPQLKQEKTVAIFTFITCFGTVMMQNWLFQAMQDLSKVAVLNLVSKIIFTILILFFVRSKGDYIWQPLALSLTQVLISVISFAWSIKKYKLKLYKVNFFDCLKMLWNEKLFFFSLCIINIYTNTNIIILGLFTDAAEVGYYTAAQKLILIFQSFISIPLAQVLFPFLSGAFKNNRESGIKIVQKTFPIVFYLTFTAGVFILILSPLIIETFYGESFLPAIAISRILSFVPMIIGLGTLIGVNVMVNLNLDKAFFRIISGGAIFSILVNFLSVNTLGAKGAAISWLLAECFNLTCMFIALNNKEIVVVVFKNFYPASIYKNIKSLFIKNGSINIS